MLDRKWRDETDERRRKSDRRWHIGEFVVSLLAFGVLIAAATLVGAFIQRGGGNREIAVQSAPSIQSRLSGGTTGWTNELVEMECHSLAEQASRAGAAA